MAQRVIIHQFLTTGEVEAMIAAELAGITKDTLGLGDVDNTADMAKPVSVAQQAEINTRAPLTHTHAIADVTGLGAELTAIDENFAGLAAVATSGAYGDLSGVPTLGTAAAAAVTDFAAAVHDHGTDYASVIHDHAGVYADAAHGHVVDDVTGLQTALDGKADDLHDHDADYAAIGHDHDTDYAGIVHNHDADYADIVHNHDADYAAVGHDHDADYAAAGHNHSGVYAEISALGDLAYEDTVHVADIAATGTPGDTTYLRGDGTWFTPPGGGGGGDAVWGGITGTLSSQGDLQAALDGKSGVAHDHDSDYAALTHDHDSDYAAITHGHAYGDITGTPTLGTAAAQDVSAFATAAQGALADTAVQPAALSGYSPTTHNHDATYAALTHGHAYGDITGTPTLATVATTGDYDDLIGAPTPITLAGDGVATTAAKSDHGHAGSHFGSMAIGESVASGGFYSHAVGKGAYAVASSTAVGYQATAQGENSVIIGKGAYTFNPDTVVIGSGAGADDATSIAIGTDTYAGAANATAIGTGVSNYDANTFAVGGDKLRLISTSSPTAANSIEMARTDGTIKTLGINNDDQVTIDGVSSSITLAGDGSATTAAKSDHDHYGSASNSILLGNGGWGTPSAGAVTIGHGAASDTAAESIAIGIWAYTRMSDDSVAIGSSAWVEEGSPSAIALGRSSSAMDAPSGIALGDNAASRADQAYAIGKDVQNNVANTALVKTNKLRLTPITASGATPIEMARTDGTIKTLAINNDDQVTIDGTVPARTISGSVNLELHGELAAGDDVFARMNFAGTWTGWDIYSKQTGSIVLDVQKDTHANYPPVAGDSVAGTAKPTISSSNKNQTTTLTGWTTAFSAGDVIRLNVDSVTTIEDVYVSLRYTRSI